MIDRELSPGPRVSRRARRVGIALAIVAVVIGIAAASGRWGVGAPLAASPGTGPTESSALADLPLVTINPSSTPTAIGVANSGVVASSPRDTPGAERGIRANRIRIARLDIDLAIIDGDGIDAPMGKAAHYPGSAWPGDGSNIYIYGHAQKGMFLTLWQARVGDTIELDLVDGTSRNYVVTEVLPKVPWDAMAYLAPTPTEQLSLQTSTSYYSTAPRFVVIAVPQA
jgi:LPXTG-site transpeptidase (sortase) family protein